MLATIGWATLSLLLVSIALCSVIPYQPKTMGGIFSYFTFSLLGQAFAPQWAILCLLLSLCSFYFEVPVFVSAITGICLSLFIFIYWRGLNSATTVATAINKAVTKLDLPPEFQAISRPKRSLPIGLRPLNIRNRDVTRHKDLAYGELGAAQTLDIYQPKNGAQKKLPILVFVHGGAWVMGSKNDQSLPLIYTLAANGWLVASINYRLGPNNRFPAMISDVLNSIEWVKQHAEEYGGNPEFIAVSGNSAGGHLSTIAALATSEQLQAQGIDAPAANISAAAPLYGRYDFLNRHNILPAPGLEPFLVEKVMPCTPSENPEMWSLASPEDLVRADAPPFLISHGSADSMAPIEEARAFKDKLASISQQPVDYLEINGAQHAFDMVWCSWAEPCIYGMLGYLNAHYQAYLKQTS